MDNWGEEKTKKENTGTTKKILIAMMILLVIIISVIVLLLMNIQAKTFKVLKDGQKVTNTTKLLKTINNTTYVNIKKMAEITGYDYHVGEYKTFSSDSDKCYIESKPLVSEESNTNTETETTSFYLNSNRICKLKSNKLDEDYATFKVESNTVQIENEFYASLDAIEKGFNVKINLTETRMNIKTLSSILKQYDSYLSELSEKSNGKTYNSLFTEELDNQKAVLYDYLILNEKDANIYGVIDANGKEILPNKYKKITFIENTKEFIVTNSQDKMGIVDAEGKNTIEQLYDSIKVINSNPKLYLVELNQKFGVLDKTGNTIVYPEYDTIGADSTIYKDLQNQYILLDSVIPVCKEKKYGLFDIKGNKLLDVKYDGIGYEKTSAEIDGVTKTVNPTVAIEDCNGIVVQEGETYNIYILGNDDITKLRVESIYYLSNNGEKTYYMVYKGKEIDLIERLIEAKIIKEKVTKTEDETTSENTIENTVANTTNNVANKEQNANIITNNVNTNNQNTAQK